MAGTYQFPPGEAYKGYQRPSDVLDSLSREFKNAGYHKTKSQAANYQQLDNAIVEIFGTPYDWDQKRDPEKGMSLLRGLKQAFDDTAAQEKKKAQDALIWKAPHAEKARNFERYSDMLGVAIQKITDKPGR
jgi:hypothetical protein